MTEYTVIVSPVEIIIEAYSEEDARNRVEEMLAEIAMYWYITSVEA